MVTGFQITYPKQFKVFSRKKKLSRDGEDTTSKKKPGFTKWIVDLWIVNSLTGELYKFQILKITNDNEWPSMPINDHQRLFNNNQLPQWNIAPQFHGASNQLQQKTWKHPNLQTYQLSNLQTSGINPWKAKKFLAVDKNIITFAPWFFQGVTCRWSGYSDINLM